MGFRGHLVASGRGVVGGGDRSRCHTLVDLVVSCFFPEVVMFRRVCPLRCSWDRGWQGFTTWSCFPAHPPLPFSPQLVNKVSDAACM